MILRYTLNNAIEGQEITTYSPKGWQETELVLSRHEKYEGIFLDYTVKVDFFCGAGKEYIDNIYETQGIEALVTVLIEMDCNETGDFETLYNGQLIMKSYEKIQSAPEYTRVNLEQIGIIQTVLNRLETKIDLTKLETLDGTAVDPLTFAPYDLTTHSKQLLMRSEFVPIQAVTPSGSLGGLLPGDNLSVDFPMYSAIGEIEFTNYVTPAFYQTGTAQPQALIETQEIFLEVTEDFRLKGSFTFQGTPVPGAQYNILTFDIVRQGPDGTDVLFSTNSAGYFEGNFIIPFDVSDTIVHTDVAVATRFSYLILMTTASPTIDPTTGFPYQCLLVLETDNTFSNFIAKSETESSITKAFAVFETGADIARKIVGQSDSFRSNYFGRTNSEPYAYNVNGCGSFSAFTNGFQLRGFPIVDKPVYMSMKEYFDGLNAIHCLGLGLKQDGDNTYIEIEGKDHFYRNTEVALTLNNVRGLTTKLDPRYFYSRFKIGFKDWRTEKVNGLDEFCTTHEYATLLKTVNNELIAQSEFIAGPYPLEKTRRNRYSSTTTTDEDYDNNNFIIALNRSVDDDNIPSDLDVAEKDENFTGVTNVLSPETIYNLRFSPARIARNWYKILGTSLIKLNDTLKTVKFSFAEGNKEMTSQGTETCDPAEQVLVTESEDLEIIIPAPLGIDFQPLFTGEIDTIEDYPLSFSSYSHLKSLDDNGIPNYYKLIRYSISDSDYLFGFIEEIRYKPITGKASFRFKRAYQQYTDCTHIYVEPGYVECGYVE